MSRIRVKLYRAEVRNAAPIICQEVGLSRHPNAAWPRGRVAAEARCRRDGPTSCRRPSGASLARSRSAVVCRALTPPPRRGRAGPGPTPPAGNVRCRPGLAMCTAPTACVRCAAQPALAAPGIQRGHRVAATVVGTVAPRPAARFCRPRRRRAPVVCCSVVVTWAAIGRRRGRTPGAAAAASGCTLLALLAHCGAGLVTPRRLAPGVRSPAVRWPARAVAASACQAGLGVVGRVVRAPHDCWRRRDGSSMRHAACR